MAQICNKSTFLFWRQYQTKPNAQLSSDIIVEGSSAMSRLSRATDFLSDKATEQVFQDILSPSSSDWNEFFSIIKL